MARKQRRVIAALLTLTMVFSLTACGGSKSDSSKDSSKKEEKEATVDTVKDPITISFWHDRTSDTDYAWLKESIDEFNKTNKYGITVEEVGQGYLDDVQAALTTAIAAGDSPVLADLSCNGIPLFASEGVLADMTPYIERDNFDMDNVVKELTDYVYYDKQVVTMPYTRGTAILYYNKDLYANAGLNQAPTSLEELNEYAKKIYDNSNGEVKGVGYTIEPTYYQHYLLGVLPTTYSSVETDTLKDFWADEKNEGYKISYEQVKDASAPAMSMYTSEWNSAVRSVYSELIQARDITPDQALDNLKSEASTIFE